MNKLDMNKLKEGNLTSLRILYKVVKKKIKKKFGTITHVETNKPLVAMTFDDGPHPIYTPMLLKVLKRFQVHATFFMVGQAALKYKWLVHEIAHDGHEIGNHTMDHLSMVSIDRKERWKQIQMCKKVLSPHGKRYLRPPYGEHNVWTNIDVILKGYEVIGWNLDVGDWWNNELSSMAEELLKKISNGSIILFHDAIYDKGNPKHKSLDQKANLNRNVTIDLVKHLLEKYSGPFRFVTISELLKNGKAERENWYK